jgi:hypothetical protein
MTVLDLFRWIRGVRRKIDFAIMKYNRNLEIFKMEIELQRSRELLRYGNAMLYLVSNSIEVPKNKTR